MKMNLKTLKRILIGLIVIFLAIFAVRAVYEITVYSEIDAPTTYGIYNSSMMESGAYQQRNFATLKMEYATDGAPVSVLDQKYERIANITSKTVNYDKDIENFDEAVSKHKAVIQTENRRGLAGNRRADFMIGVKPEYFDDMQKAVSEIGRITSSNITKTDKTYEYRQMLAEKDTLERRRESYTELRRLGGTIPELLQLEERIIEVESQIQMQQIGLGEFSDDNALCTINFTIQEGSEISVPLKLWNALKWTVSFYLATVGIICLTTLAAVVLAACWNYIKRAFGGNKPSGSSKKADAKINQNADSENTREKTERDANESAGGDGSVSGGGGYGDTDSSEGYGDTDSREGYADTGDGETYGAADAGETRADGGAEYSINYDVPESGASGEKNPAAAVKNLIDKVTGPDTADDDGKKTPV